MQKPTALFISLSLSVDYQMQKSVRGGGWWYVDAEAMIIFIPRRDAEKLLCALTAILLRAGKSGFWKEI